MISTDPSSKKGGALSVLFLKGASQKIISFINREHLYNCDKIYFNGALYQMCIAVIVIFYYKEYMLS